jgi:PAS domain S-box-containing protein
MADVPESLGVELLDSVLTHAGVAVWAADDEAHGYAVVHWSPGAEALYGYPASEVLGRSYLDLFVAEGQRQRAIDDHRRLLTDPSTAIHWSTTATDLDARGNPVTVLFSTFRFWWERYERYVLLEVSIGLPAEAIVGDLADAPGERAVVTSEDQLVAMVDDAQGGAVTDTYRRIVPLLLHRLGNPVDAIRFEVGELASPVGRVQAEPRMRAQRIADNVARIDRLLEELDRLSEGVPARTPLNLHQVVESTRLATLTQEFRYVEVRNEVASGLEWTTHELILREVLSTLIVNACESVTREHGGGDVEVTAHVDAYGHLVIDIDDTGPGFPRAAFATNRRRASSKGRAHGRGLLYAERALEMVSGRLDLSHERSPLGGARVTIVLDA